jgi:hypothetical protein
MLAHVERPHHREAGDGDPLASGGIPSLVALEIKAAVDARRRRLRSAG